MRYLRYLVLAILALSLLVLALANRGAVTLRLLPEDLALLFGFNAEWQVPLFLIVLAGILAGLILGFVWEWAREMKHRTAARTGSRTVAKLEREIAVMRDSSGLPEKDEVLAILNGKKA